MTKMFLSLSMIFISFIMFFINHPISMGLLILLQTLFMSILLGMLINSYWFSYILFLVFLGGLLVLFIYVSSIASNERLNFPLMYKFSYITPLLIICTSIFYKNNLNWLNFSFNEDMNNFNNMFLFTFNENNFNLIKLYNSQTYLLMFLMIIYLLITLIAVVKITNIFFGPLRSFN